MKFDDIFMHVDTIHQRGRRTDGQTDTGRRQRPRLRIASRGRKPVKDIPGPFSFMNPLSAEVTRSPFLFKKITGGYLNLIARQDAVYCRVWGCFTIYVRLSV